MANLTGHGWPRLAAWAAAVLLNLAGALPALAAGTVLAGGPGSGSRLLQALAEEYRRTARGAEIDVSDPPIGSSAAIRAVREGRLHIAISSRPLKDEERGDDLAELEFVRTPLVFASRDDFQAGGFTLGQLEDIYSGRQMQWNNGIPIRLVLRSKFASDTRVIRAMSPGLDRAASLALERKGMVVAATDLEALEMIEQTPGSLGPTTLGLVRVLDSKVRVLSIAGRMPSARTLADGSYPWFKSLYLVVRKKTGADVQAFLNYLRSPQAADFLGRIEYLPASHGE